MQQQDTHNSFTVSDAPGEAIRVLFADEDRHLQLLMWDYYRAIAEETGSVTDASLLVKDAGGSPAMLVPLTRSSNTLTYFGTPAAPVFSASLNLAARKAALEAAASHLTAQRKQDGTGFTLLTPATATGEASRLDILLLEAGARPSLRYRGVMRLDGGEDVLRGRVRRRYRTFVNWGRREMRLEFHLGTKTEAAVFDRLRAFHAQTAGRVTRSRASWNEMLNLAATGRGFLCMGYLGEQLVAATYVYLNRWLALYGTGVYERSLFDKPISHWPMLACQAKAHELGSALFDIGEVYLPAAAIDKEHNIAYFKRGFAENVEAQMYWTALAEAADEAPDARARAK